MTKALPPNQQLVSPGKWPVVGERAAGPGPEFWTLHVHGRVENEMRFSLDALRALPRVERSIDIHCVTRWSALGRRFRGVLLEELLARTIPMASASHVSFVARSTRGHSTSLRLDDALALGTLIALEHDDLPLPADHGGPLRTIVPGRYFYKSLKWLEAIELLDTDRLGTWERESGYHNVADPWREERYAAANLDRREVEDRIGRRDFRDRELRSLSADDRDLAELDARSALLRDASFRGARLERARFDGANLSNARFSTADLREASFRDADVEGADFCGADLRGTDLRVASMFGATFRGARIDLSTRIDESAIDQLTPGEASYVRAALRLV